jgi:hypothetical protein
MLDTISNILIPNIEKKAFYCEMKIYIARENNSEDENIL